MSEATARKRADKALKKLVAGMVAAVGETLGSLVDKELHLQIGSGLQCVDADDWITSLEGTTAVIRGALDKDFAGRHLLLAFDLLEAITLSGCLMMTPEEVINEHRSARLLDGDHVEAFSEVSNILCSGVDTLLRDALGANVGLRVRDHAIVKPGLDQEEILGEGELIVYDFSVRIGDYPESKGFVILDPITAKTWNKDRNLFGGAQQTTATSSHPGAEDEEKPLEGEEDIPQAPMRGSLSAFLAGQDCVTAVRLCGRRIGLEIHRHSRTDIPNPAAHRGEVVLIEIPVGEDKRFDWARRIKQHHANIPVVLLIHEPSRARVVQGFMTKANVILAWPSKEAQLSSKIEPLIALCTEGEAEDE